MDGNYPNNHKQISGLSGTGKTTLVRILLASEVKDEDGLLIVDVDEDYGDEFVEHRAYDVQNLDAYLAGLQPGEPFSCSIVPPEDEAPEVTELVTLYAWGMQGPRGRLSGGRRVIVVVEESHESLVQPAPLHAKRCAKRGRKRNIGFWAVGQRPVDVDVKVRSQMEGNESWYLRHESPADLDIIARAHGRELSDRVKALPNLHAIRLRPGSGEGPKEFKIVDYSRLVEVT